MSFLRFTDCVWISRNWFSRLFCKHVLSDCDSVEAIYDAVLAGNIEFRADIADEVLQIISKPVSEVSPAIEVLKGVLRM